MSTSSTLLPGRCTAAALRDRLPSGLGLDLDTLAPAMAAALWVLSLFPHDDKGVWDHVGPAGLDVEALAFPGGDRPRREQVLLRAAASIAMPMWEVSLHALATELDPVGWAVVSEALRVAHFGLAGGPR